MIGGSPPLDPHMGPNPHPLAKIHGYSHWACHKWLVSELFHTISGLRQTFFRFLSNWLLTIDKRKKKIKYRQWSHLEHKTAWWHSSRQLRPSPFLVFVCYIWVISSMCYENHCYLCREIDSPTSNFKQEGSYHARVIWYEMTIRAKAISHIRNWTKRIDFFTLIHSI